MHHGFPSSSEDAVYRSRWAVEALQPASTVAFPHRTFKEAAVGARLQRKGLPCGSPFLYEGIAV